MKELIFVSILWSFSFSFIGIYLSGQVDSYLAVLIRFTLAAIVLTPFLKLRNVPRNFIAKIIGIGAIQIGLMYMAFYNSFLFLSVPEVILFTIFTPLYISFFGELFEKKINFAYILSALIAVIGAGIIRWNNISPDFLIGFLLVQLANLSFGTGQILYKYAFKSLAAEQIDRIKNRDIFALFYYGAILIALPATLIFGNLEKIPHSKEHYLVLLWLGIAASGVGYVLWNQGARKVNNGTLAIMNNVVIPIGILVNLIIWNTETDFTKLIIGSAVILLSFIPIRFKKLAVNL